MIYYITIFTLALCSIIYELGFAYTLTLIYGSSVFYYSVTIGIYIFAMGLGSFLYDKITQKHKNYKKIFFLSELSLVLLSLLSIPVMFYLVTYNAEANYFNHIFIYSLIVLIGLLTGFEIPIINDISNKKLTTILGIDYFGTLVGTIVFSLLLLPTLGLVTTIYSITILNLFIIILVLYKNKKIVIFSSLLILAILYGISVLNIGNLIENIYMYKIIQKKECVEKPCEVAIIDNIQTQYQNVTYANLHFPKNKKVKKKFDIQCMYIDKEVQFCNNWAYSYHHFLAQVPLNIKTNKNLNVLLLGGGDFYAASFILNNDLNNDKNITLTHIDIDSIFFNYVNKHINIGIKEKLLSMKNYHFYNGDAFNYLSNINKKKYDIIFFDLPILKNEKLLPLYSIEMYTMLFNSLKKDGFLVDTYEGKDKYNETTIKKAGFNYQYIYDGFMIGMDKKNPINQYFEYSDRFTIITKNKIPKLDKDKKEFKRLSLKIDKNIRLNKIFKPNYNYIIKDHETY